ncbi:uncharacterized protein Z518_09641 [Rhinocladiella mackenziei CBS 650.93]|uniref:Glycoside hydrolase family 39 protein n=1 Tax=Rhinocladiella mackenziei CBS 650.93 TaxID=1442369 RepID=A0A0D2IBB0_9EURO|nr:uncharacterized protein Z518_09641 [Rhinocladiella mackenziei CBS 650.93]KIX00576.1 hypothetical protein Z518_09641 [Rhinocladiella mackenziei CBS 650.93]
MKCRHLFVLFSALSQGYARFTGSPVKRSLGTATVSLAMPSGTPEHLGSGVLYGVPINDGQVSTQIPDHFFTEMGYNFGRAGGSAWPEPNRGWSVSPSEYTFRFQSALSNYRTARKFGASFFLLSSDLWANVVDSTPFPGDNGDWTYYDDFLTQLISDIQANDMTEGLIIDIWNEPDIAGFWARDQSQYREMWGRTYHRLKADLPGVSLAGPSASSGPSSENAVFTGWAEFVGANQSVPDVYTWHALNPATSPTQEADYFATQRSNLGLPSRPININEYLAYGEVGPSPLVYYLAQFERLGIRGLRANWAKGGEDAFALHNYLANLLGPQGATSGYYPNGEWQVYKYYAAMGGERVATTPSSDGVLEVYATTGSPIKVLTSARQSTGTYSITMTGFSAVGITGQVTKRSLGFTWNDVFGEVGDPVDFGTEVHTIVDDAVTFDVIPRTTTEAYAFEFS